jgi:hypothetical protein
VVVVGVVGVVVGVVVLMPVVVVVVVVVDALVGTDVDGVTTVVVDPLSLEAMTARATPRPMTTAIRSTIAAFMPVLMPLGGGS